MADQDEEEWRKDPEVLRKYTWEKNDVEWAPDDGDPPPPPIKGLETKEQRRAAWRKLAPNEPYPPKLREPGDDDGSTTDSVTRRAKLQPKVKVHLHRAKR